MFMLLCSQFNVPMVMISGDRAVCAEAVQLTPSITTVAVIEGQKRGSTEGMSTQEALDLNVPAVHVAPVRARAMIKAGARSCLSKVGSVERFWIDPPYEMVRITRPDEQGVVRRAVSRSNDYVDLIGQPIEYEEPADPGN